MSLKSLIEREMLRPFVWGECDCCLAVCNVLRDMDWPDPAAAYRGRYSDEAGAREIMGGTVLAVAKRETARLGWPEIEPDAAQDGDVGVVRESLAIRRGRRWYLKSERGMISTSRADRAWRPTCAAPG